MINPINHAKFPEGIATYKIEPYVVAADVYAVPPHTGRGGWTWYTDQQVGCTGLSWNHYWGCGLK